MAPDVRPGDLWRVGDQVYHAQTGSSGILLQPVLLPDQLTEGAELVFRARNQKGD